jgi:predicted CXXCH cytochrome family protein
MVGELQRLLVTQADLVNDIHWQKGLQCHDCHGGDPTQLDFLKAHAATSGFRHAKPAINLPDFCGHCHSDPEYMRRYSPSLRTDQAAIYWTSGHGQKLKQGDDKVATCISCHGGRHNLRAVADTTSPVYPTNVATTCGTCHSDAERMAGREHRGRPIGHEQVELWKRSIHAKLLLEQGDMSAPTCNDCHGNHGALAPEIGSVANVCGTCHVKIGELFSQTRMKHRFEEVNLPGCATCHDNHEILSPTDEMLGMQSGAVCLKCHNEGQFGATFVGARVAQDLRRGLDELKTRITTAEERLDRAERLGMEVREPRFQLRGAEDALTNARTAIHSFSTDITNEALHAGLAVCDEVEQAAQKAIDEYTHRRIWLAASLAPIFIVVGLLLLYIRTLPVPTA